tara:strand:+ start:127 stop:516 length:390 start_codon:yes stop_codon:yes gene_type:complete
LKKNNIKISSNRSFGIVFCFVFLFIAFYPILKDAEIRFWSIIVSTIFLILGLINSKLLTPLNKIWFKFGILLGNIVSPIVMGVIFFCVVTPISLALKLLGKDVINVNKNKDKSYWIKKSGPKSKMKNQF